MIYSKRFMRIAAILTATIGLVLVGSDATAQIVIGGDDGVVIGGGQGLRIGGQNGAQFGGGQGAKFGGPSGVQFGGGVGAKFGGENGVQFGGGEGAKFGGDDGVQFGGGEGAKFGPLQVGEDSGKERIDEADEPAERRVARPRPTTLYYPEDAKEPLDFTLNDHKFKVEPGQTVRLDSEFIWLIQFAAKAEGEVRHYTLPPGSYTFKQKDGRWNLFRDKAPQPAAKPVPESEEVHENPRDARLP